MSAPDQKWLDETLRDLFIMGLSYALPPTEEDVKEDLAKAKEAINYRFELTMGEDSPDAKSAVWYGSQSKEDSNEG